MERQVRVSASSAVCGALVGVAALLATAGAVPRTIGDGIATRAAEGARLYEKGRYKQALKAYLDAQLEAPESPLLHFNIGDALYQTGDLEGALSHFQGATEKGPDAVKAVSLYNSGIVYFQQGQYSRAAQAFRQALEYNSEDDDARANLELALLRLHEQQQLQQGEEGEKSEENDGEGESAPAGEGTEEEEGEREQEQEEQQSGEDTDSNDRPSDPEEDTSGSEAEVMAQWEAEQLLDAFEDRELEGQRLRYRGRRQNQQKDW